MNQEAKVCLDETKKPRLTIDFSQNAAEDLSVLAKKLDTSKVGAIRQGLSLLKLLLEQSDEGFEILLRNKKEGSEREILFLK